MLVGPHRREDLFPRAFQPGLMAWSAEIGQADVKVVRHLGEPQTTQVIDRLEYRHPLVGLMESRAIVVDPEIQSSGEHRDLNSIQARIGITGRNLRVSCRTRWTHSTYCTYPPVHSRDLRCGY